MMHYTKSCREVIGLASIQEFEYRTVEHWMMEHSPDQVRRLIKQKDMDGEHDAKWFDPFFRTGYVPRIGRLRSAISMDGAFWEAYDCLAQFVDDDFWTDDMELIYEMSRDPERMRFAVGQSKPNIRYVFKVFSSSYKQAPQTNAPPPEIRNRRVGINRKWEPSHGLT